jgi:hypothetical protein
MNSISLAGTGRRASALYSAQRSATASARRPPHQDKDFFAIRRVRTQAILLFPLAPRQLGVEGS